MPKVGRCTVLAYKVISLRQFIPGRPSFWVMLRPWNYLVAEVRASNAFGAFCIACISSQRLASMQQA